MKKGRISKADEWLMIGTAIFFDALAGIVSLLNFLLPPLGTILSLPIVGLGFATLWLWFTIKRVSLFNSQKKILGSLATAVIEIIPFLNLLPAVTFFTIRTILVVKLEDKQNISSTLSRIKNIAEKRSPNRGNDVKRAA